MFISFSEPVIKINKLLPYTLLFTFREGLINNLIKSNDDSDDIFERLKNSGITHKPIEGIRKEIIGERRNVA